MRAEIKIKTCPGDFSEGHPAYQQAKRDAIIEALWLTRGLSLKELESVCIELKKRIEIARSVPGI